MDTFNIYGPSDAQKKWLKSLAEEINALASLYIEKYRALLALESNINVDVIALSMQLHQLHKTLIEKVTFLFYHPDWMEKDAATKVVDCLINKGYSLETVQGSELAWNYTLYIDIDHERQYLDFEEDDDTYLFHLTGEAYFCLYLNWQEYSHDGYHGEEPKIEDFIDLKKEAFIKSLGLEPHYVSDATYHSRSIKLLGVKPGTWDEDEH